MKKRATVFLLCVCLAGASLWGTGLAIGGTLVFGSADDTSTLAKAQILPSTDVTIMGEITDSADIDNYRFTVPVCGRLEIQLTIKSDMVYLRVLDEAGDYALSKLVSASDTKTKGFCSVTADLNPGNYFIQLSAYGASKGDYIAQTGFTPSTAQYLTGSNNIATANKIELNESFTGFLAHKKELIMSRVDVTQGGRLSFNIAMQPDSINFYLYDASGGQIIGKIITLTSMGAIGFTEIYADVNPGSYYVCFKQDSGRTGWYTVMPSFTAAGNTDTEPNDTFESANTISLSQQVKGLLAYKDKADNYKLTVPSSGTLTLRLNQQMEQASYSIYNSSGVRIANKLAYLSETVGKGFVDWSVSLPTAGYYYISVEQQGTHTGWYSFMSSMSEGGTSSTGYDFRVGSYTLKLRQLPSTSASVIDTLANGQKMKVLETSGAWSRVELLDGRTGWLASANVGISPYLGNQGTSELRVLSGTLKFRASASSSAVILEDFKNGRKVVLLDNTSSTAWVKVSTSAGVTGWVGSAYVGLAN